ncbi:MAG: ribosome-associated translation inhibitor RaiA [Candidatus Andersenbacteria bacterium]|nr:ribosome-associated translation inhibitor RaiA [Candidatus Andersenbacteria bacterium]
MHYSLTTQHIELSAADTRQIDEKLARIQKYLNPPFQIDIVLKHDTHHQQGMVISCRVNVQQGGKVIHAEREAASALTALDECVEALQQELKKAGEKQRRTRSWRSWFGRRE